MLFRKALLPCLYANALKGHFNILCELEEWFLFSLNGKRMTLNISFNLKAT